MSSHNVLRVVALLACACASWAQLAELVSVTVTRSFDNAQDYPAEFLCEENRARSTLLSEGTQFVQPLGNLRAQAAPTTLTSFGNFNISVACNLHLSCRVQVNVSSVPQVLVSANVTSSNLTGSGTAFSGTEGSFSMRYKSGEEGKLCSGHGSCESSACVCHRNNTLGYWAGSRCHLCLGGSGWQYTLSSNCTTLRELKLLTPHVNVTWRHGRSELIQWESRDLESSPSQAIMVIFRGVDPQNPLEGFFIDSSAPVNGFTHFTVPATVNWQGSRTLYNQPMVGDHFSICVISRDYTNIGQCRYFSIAAEDDRKTCCSMSNSAGRHCIDAQVRAEVAGRLSAAASSGLIDALDWNYLCGNGASTTVWHPYCALYTKLHGRTFTTAANVDCPVECGDGLCSPGETTTSCPADCGSTSSCPSGPISSSLADPLASSQWQLEHIRAAQAWQQGASGGQAQIAVVDDGLQHRHGDFACKYDADASKAHHDGLAADAVSDPGPFANVLTPHPYGPSGASYTFLGTRRWHGTAVAGAAAALDNGVCGAGAAPRARIAGYKMEFSVGFSTSDYTRFLSFRRDRNWIYNLSFGTANGYLFADKEAAETVNTIRENVDNGRSGRGNVYVTTAGNDRARGDSSMYEGLANVPYVMTVGATNRAQVQASYSEPGANVFIAAPGGDSDSGIVSSDLLSWQGIDAAEGASGHCFRNTTKLSGTSFAAPIVSGVAALILDANPELRPRDVMHIIARTAIQNDPGDSSWSHTVPVRGAAYHVNDKYGFGIVNADGAVSLARRWTHVPARAECVARAFQALSVSIPPSPSFASVAINASSCGSSVAVVEHVVAEVSASHGKRGDIVVELVSPTGRKSVLSPGRDLDTSTAGFAQMPLMSVRHWGEDVRGEWRVHVYDRNTDQNSGTWTGVSLKFYGSSGAIPSQFNCTGDGASCGCAAGFAGANCSVEIDYCALYGQPCVHGQCSNRAGASPPYQCSCPLGYTGTNCSDVVSDSSPPVAGSVVIAALNTSFVRATWSGFADAQSGIASYRVSLVALDPLETLVAPTLVFKNESAIFSDVDILPGRFVRVIVEATNLRGLSVSSASPDKAIPAQQQKISRTIKTLLRFFASRARNLTNADRQVGAVETSVEVDKETVPGSEEVDFEFGAIEDPGAEDFVDPSASGSGRTAFGGSFYIRAVVGGQRQSSFALNPEKPMVVTQRLRNDSSGDALAFQPGDVALYFYDKEKQTWVLARDQCKVPFDMYNRTSNELTTHVCHMTQFQVYSSSTNATRTTHWVLQSGGQDTVLFVRKYCTNDSDCSGHGACQDDGCLYVLFFFCDAFCVCCYGEVSAIGQQHVTALSIVQAGRPRPLGSWRVEIGRVECALLAGGQQLMKSEAVSSLPHSGRVMVAAVAAGEHRRRTT